jgi:hypothetical protein
MAEAIAAFGVAANIIQFIDLGSRLTANMWGFYKGTGGAAKEIPNVESINIDLQRILRDLDDDSACADHGLVQLAKDCRTTATELETKIQPMVHARLHARGKREAFKAAVKSMWEEKEISSLQDRLHGFRHQLTLHLLASLRYFKYLYMRIRFHSN